TASVASILAKLRDCMARDDPLATSVGPLHIRSGKSRPCWRKLRTTPWTPVSSRGRVTDRRVNPLVLKLKKGGGSWGSSGISLSTGRLACYIPAATCVPLPPVPRWLDRAPGAFLLLAAGPVILRATSCCYTLSCQSSMYPLSVQRARTCRT